MKSVLCIIAILVLAVISPNLAVASDGLFERIVDLEKRVSILESTINTEGNLSGQGSGNTMPFTVRESPWMLQWKTSNLRQYDTSIGLELHTANTTQMVAGFGGTISSNMTTSKTAVYSGPGTYYLHISTPYWVKWSISVQDKF